MRRSRICSSAPAASSASAISCCGKWPTPSCISLTLCGRPSTARHCRQPSIPIRRASAALAEPVNSCKKAMPMLKQRVITAIILLLLFLSALFMLPAPGWIALIMLMVMQGASEWTRLAQLTGRSGTTYWWLTLAVMGGIVWFDADHTLAQHANMHMLVYAVSALLWLIIVPFWLGMGWQ